MLKMKEEVPPADGGGKRELIKLDPTLLVRLSLTHCHTVPQVLFYKNHLSTPSCNRVQDVVLISLFPFYFRFQSRKRKETKNLPPPSSFLPVR